MKRAFTGFILFTFLAGTALANAPQPDNPADYEGSWWKRQENKTHEYAPDHLLIKLHREVVDNFRSTAELHTTDLPDVHQLNQQFDYSSFYRLVNSGGELDQLARDHDLDLHYVIEFEASQNIDELIWQYEDLPSVEEARPDWIVHAMFTPNDSYYSSQWMHKNTGQAVAYGGGYVGTTDCDLDTDQAWDISQGSSGVTIAIIDTGVDLDHSEFSGRMTAGYDFVNNDSNANDDNMHGTACAGLAAAKGNNGSGVAGVNFNCMIMPIKVLDSGGSGWTSDIVDGVNWARTNGADVVSMSLGGGGYDGSFNSAINACVSAGVVVVSASGNDNASSISYPAAYSGSMAIGAVSPCNERKHPSSCDGEYWWGSNYGTGLDVMAPSPRLHSTYYNGGYMSDMGGTSGSTPQVAGIAALIKTVNPGLSVSEIRNIITNSADDMGSPGWDSQTGYGRANAYQALLQAGGGTDPIIDYDSHSISDANGQLDPGETVDMYVTLYNAGAEATGVSVTLSESSSWVSFSTATRNYGTIGAGSYDTNGSPFVLSADPGTPVGTSVNITVSITASGGYSNTDSFTIVVGTPPEFTECQTTPVSIPDNTTVYSTLTLSQSTDIIDIEVYVDISHTYIGDLQIILTSPGSTSVTLHNRSGGSSNDIEGWYDSELPVDGPGSLSDFFGENCNGTWTLSIDDNYTQDTGTLNEWCLWISGEEEEPENTPPVVSDIPDQYITEGQSFSQIHLDNYVSDAQTPDASIIWSYAGNVELTVSIVNRIATIGIPHSDWNGTEVITFTAEDQGGLTDSDAATFWVQGVNDPPVVSNIPNQTITEGQAFAQIHLDDYVDDLEDPDSWISWTYAGNSALTVDITNRIATITYPGGWTGSETITFTAWDSGGLDDSDPATFTVEAAANTPPLVGDIPDQYIDEGDTFTQINLDGYVTDAETPDALIDWTYGGNTELTVSIVNRIATIGIPDSDWNGAEEITFTAEDEGGLTDDDAATFWVAPINDPPVVTNIPNQSINEGEAFTLIYLDNYVSDVEDPDALINWTYAGNVEMAVDITDRVATITYPGGPRWSGAETITFTAWDTGGLDDSDAATFTVGEVNDPPLVTDIPDQVVDEDYPFLLINLDDYVTDEESPDALISWTYSGNLDLLVDITDRVATITAPYPHWFGSETITFTAEDEGGLTDDDPATFTAVSVNDPPVVADIPDQTVDAGDSFLQISLDNYVMDVEDPPAAISWTCAGNVDLTVDITGNVATITYPEGWVGAETLTFTAWDTGGLDDSDAATFTVLPAVDPVNDLTISWEDPNVVLTWSAMPGAVNYAVYRMLEPYAIGSATLVQTTTGTTVSLAGELSYVNAFYYVIVNY